MSIERLKPAHFFDEDRLAALKDALGVSYRHTLREI
jgi:hypothetical protein